MFFGPANPLPDTYPTDILINVCQYISSRIFIRSLLEVVKKAQY